MSELRREVVRAFGSGRCHVADVPADALMDVEVFGSHGQAVALDPVVTACRAQLKESRGVVLVMTKAKVDCRTCARMTGIEKVAADGC